MLSNYYSLKNKNPIDVEKNSKLCSFRHKHVCERMYQKYVVKFEWIFPVRNSRLYFNGVTLHRNLGPNFYRLSKPLPPLHNFVLIYKEPLRGMLSCSLHKFISFVFQSLFFFLLDIFLLNNIYTFSFFVGNKNCHSHLSKSNTFLLIMYYWFLKTYQLL